MVLSSRGGVRSAVTSLGAAMSASVFSPKIPARFTKMVIVKIKYLHQKSTGQFLNLQTFHFLSNY